MYTVDRKHYMYHQNLFCAFLAVPHNKAYTRPLCLHFSYKACVFATHILIGCRYCLLHPEKTVTV
jgi:hypothetical protein